MPLTNIMALVLVTAVGLSHSPSVRADSIWLDEPLTQWNVPNGAIPHPVTSGPEPFTDPRCSSTNRPPETDTDFQILDAGWSLFNSYEVGWGVTLVSGLKGHDGMCRPWNYHGFVFLNGQFAGTLAPEPSAARSDGALVDSHINGDGRLSARFVRYATDDPLCCPSRPAVLVDYRVDRTPQGPVLVAERRTEVPR